MDVCDYSDCSQKCDCASRSLGSQAEDHCWFGREKVETLCIYLRPSRLDSVQVAKDLEIF